MNNPFEAHGIRHLSPSSANLFCSAPALWVMEKVLKVKTHVGSSAHRGTAVETGIVAGLMDPSKSVEECAEIASAEFRRLTPLSRDPSKPKEAAAVPLIVEQGLIELRPYGVPTLTQGKIEHIFEGVSVPFIGYYDLFWENHGIIVDIKSQLRLSSEIKPSHARQVALYKHAISDNLDARISYITDKKAATYPLENSRAHLESLRLIGLAIQKFLSTSDDPHELVGMVAPDFEHFYWNNPDTRHKGFELFGY